VLFQKGFRLKIKSKHFIVPFIIVCNVAWRQKNIKTTFQEEVNRDIFGRQDQGGGLWETWNGRKLKEEV
jgi:hypothetical protein